MDQGEGESQSISKLYSFEELQAIAESAQAAVINPCSDNWPKDVVADDSKRIFWLPTDWAQGLKPKANGKSIKVFVSPEGGIFYRQKEIEKRLGRKLDYSRTERCISTAVPTWPDWDLPHDWRLGYRKLPSQQLHPIYVPPNQNEGFLMQKYEVEAYLAGVEETLTLFSEYDPGNRSEKRPKKKRQKTT